MSFEDHVKSCLNPKELEFFIKIACYYESYSVENRSLSSKLLDHILFKLETIETEVENKRKECSESGESDISDKFKELYSTVVRLETYMKFLRELETFISKEEIVSVQPRYRKFLFSKEGGFLTQQNYI